MLKMFHVEQLDLWGSINRGAYGRGTYVSPTPLVILMGVKYGQQFFK